MIAALCCHSRLARIDWSKSLSASFKRFSSQLKILRSQARSKFHWKLPMQSLTNRHSAHLSATKSPERRTSASVRMNCTAQRLTGRTVSGLLLSNNFKRSDPIVRANGSNQHVSLWNWDSLPFGENPPNTNPSNLGTTFFKHRFPGQYGNPETGLHQNWNRKYDAVLGRNIASNPFGLIAGANLYRYVVVTQFIGRIFRAI